MKNITTSLILLFVFQLSFGQIAFDSHTVISNVYITNFAQSVNSADLDNDGDMDVLVASSGKISWFENLDGQGNFSNLKIISNDVYFGVFVLASDIDGDGDLDVLSASQYQDKISWYQNLDGAGNFSSQNVISSNADFVKSIFVSDIDGDGDVDVLSASLSDDKIAWYENTDGLGTFNAEQIIDDNADGASFVYTADIDGDGDQDVLSASQGDDTIAWYENVNGQAGFGNKQVITNTANGAKLVLTGDFDNDGDVDVLSVSNLDDTIKWYNNIDGQGSFMEQQVITSSINGVDFALISDFDNDGDLDVLASSSTEDNIVWFENLDGQGSFGDLQDINYFNSVSSFDIADVNDDGLNDVISVSTSDRTAWHKNLDGDNFEEQPFLSDQAHHIRGTYPADIDNDGDIDLFFAANSTLGWFDNLGNGVFNPQHNPMPHESAVASTFPADLDNDGDVDLVVGRISDGDIVWYENIDGQGDFSASNLITSDASIAYSITAADVDGDGDLDVLSASTGDNKIAWYQNIDGLGTFSNQLIISDEAYGARSVFSADLDGDGDLDVLSAAASTDKISWYENLNGNGSFGPEIVISDDELSVSFVSSGDIDNDGDMDILASSVNQSSVLWFQNDGLGNFGPSLNVTDSARSAKLVDLDNDGDLDVVARVVSGGQRLIWFEKIDGTTDFGEEQVISQIESDEIIIGDIDSDGDQDLIIEYGDGNSTGEIIWFENLGRFNEISGTLTLDIDGDGCDDNDIVSPNFLIHSDGENNNYSTFTLSDGSFQIFTRDGEYSTSVLNLPSFYEAIPASFESDFAGFDNVNSVDFCLTPLAVIDDLNVSIYPSLNQPRPGFDTTYQLVYNNVGTTQLNGSVTFEFDETKLQFLNASETVSSQTSNTLTFDYSDLNPFETRMIDLEFNVFAPPMTEIGNELVTIATINPVIDDETEDDNTFELQQIVIGSYDPNDITCLEGEQILIDDVDKYLHYLIRFQNTGTASAINVRVENVLDGKLDWTTMILESFSHDGRVEILNGSEVSFIFDNINLPASTNNETNSHGFIAYKIKPKSDVVLGDIFYNTADIYFDYNPPIITNTYETEIVEEQLSISKFENNTFKIFPNPTNSKLTIQSKVGVNKIKIVDINGRLLNTIDNLDLSQEVTLDVENLSKGIYFLKIQAEHSEQVIRFIRN